MGEYAGLVGEYAGLVGEYAAHAYAQAHEQPQHSQ